MGIRFTNNAATTLAAGILATATEFTVAANKGALFPALDPGNYCYLTLADNSGNMEIVKATARALDVFTVVRAQDGTPARDWLAGTRVQLRLPRVALEELAAYQPLQDHKASGDHDIRYDTKAQVDAKINAAAFAPAGHDHDDSYEPLNPAILKSDTHADLTVGFRAGTTGATEVSGVFQPTYHNGNVRRFNLTANSTLAFVAGNFGTHVYLIDRSASNFTLSLTGFDKIIGAVGDRFALVTVVAVDGRAIAFIEDVS